MKKYDCRYQEICNLYDPESRTCKNNGGINGSGNPYCGKYREYEEKRDIIEIDKEINELSSHRFFDKQYDKDPKKREAIEKKITSLIEMKIMKERIGGISHVKNGK